MLLFLLSLFGSIDGNSQTVLISPTGDGGFENGATFTANGWSVSNYVNNPWIVGSYANGAITGNAAFVSNNGTTPTYDNTLTCSNYFWRDVTVPAGQSKIKLNFNWIANGESTWDLWQVFVAPTSVTPVGGAHPGSGATLVPAAITGATWVANGNLQTTVQSAEVFLPTNLAGTTFRLIFHWKSDTSTGNPLPAVIDNISLVSSAPGNYVTIASGNWGDAAIWDSGIVPTMLDSATITAGHAVTINATGQMVNNLTVNGTLGYTATPTSFGVNGNLTVGNDGFINVFSGTTGKTLTLAGNVTNNGNINVSVGTGAAGN
ncbi:MAG: hypothetical protein EOP51_29235 [Sphingobacteriales bacterium]|nr:MAG: hypothetical protein EOP51_29235 [Sphingobacteriales bacterium]